MSTGIKEDIVGLLGKNGSVDLTNKNDTEENK